MDEYNKIQTVDATTEPVPADNNEPEIGEIGTGDDEAGEDETEADGDEDTGVTDAA